MRHSFAIIFLAALYAASVGVAFAEESPGSGDPPNIVLIIADDQAWSDFGFMGNERVHTPHLDRLARRAAVFPNGYVPSSVCRPSLVTMLTGLYPHEHGVHFNHGPPGNAGYNRMTSRAVYERTRAKEFALIRRCRTLPELLRERGYRCLQTGKFWEGHWRNARFTEGMTTFEPPPLDQTFGGLRTLASGERVAHGNGDRGLLIGRRTMAPIRDFVRSCEAAKTPWFVWYAPYLPHQPHDSAEAFYELARESGARPHELPYYASIAQFDATVGELLSIIQRHADQNTLFAFVSDNGWRPSRERQRGRPEEFAHTKRSKRAPFDEGLRTPIFFAWNDVIRPGVYPELVSSVDLAPTLTAAARRSPAVNATERDAAGDNQAPTRMSGRDLLPLLVAGDTAPLAGRAVFGEVYPGDATTLQAPEREVAYRWIRRGKWKLIVPESQGGAPWGGYLHELALFNLESDPAERRNLAAEPEQAERVRSLRAQLNQWWSLQPRKQAGRE